MRCLVAAAMFVTLGGVDLARAAEAPVGHWRGTVQAGPIALRLHVAIADAPGGGLSATLTSLDQDGQPHPIDEVTWQNGVLRLVLRRVGAFQGVYDVEQGEIAGNWEQGAMTLPLVLRPADGPPVLRRPQDPQPPFPYEQAEVVFANEVVGIRLAGTLTTPRTPGPHPVALLLSGSGPQDRDEALFGHRPFLVLADHLTRNGIAVLRFDDRGVGGSTGRNTGATTEDFVSDALAGVAFLRGRAGIDVARIGLIGHSEGGLVASRAAARTRDIAWIVMLASPGLPGEALARLQAETVPRAEGAPDTLIAWNRALTERLLAVLKSEPDPAAAKSKLRAIAHEESASLDSSIVGSPAALEVLVQSAVDRISGPWFRHLLTLDPATSLRAVDCPVLVAFGALDCQVPPRENAPPLEAALKAGGNRDHAVRVLPGLNHLLQTAKTGAVSEYGAIEETVAPAALDLITGWIRARSAK